MKKKKVLVTVSKDGTAIWFNTNYIVWRKKSTRGEKVDARDLKSLGETHAGSSPAACTILGMDLDG